MDNNIKHNSKDIDNRLATMEGHLRGIRQMVADGKSCDEILLQLTALRGSIDNLSKKLLIEHAQTCVRFAVENNDLSKYDEFIAILSKYI